MFGLKEIVGGGLKLGGAIYGGIKASKAMRDIRRNIAEQKKANKDRYNKLYNEDATQRVDAQRMLTTAQERLRARNRAAAGAAAIGGASTAAAAAEKAANSRAMASATAAIAENAERRKDNIENQYRATNAALDDQLNGFGANHAQQMINAANTAASTGSDIASLIPEKEKGDTEPKKKVKEII